MTNHANSNSAACRELTAMMHTLKKKWSTFKKMVEDTQLRRSTSVVSMLGEGATIRTANIATMPMEKNMPIVPTVAKNGHYEVNCTYVRRFRSWLRSLYWSNVSVVTIHACNLCVVFSLNYLVSACGHAHKGLSAWVHRYNVCIYQYYSAMSLSNAHFTHYSVSVH